MQLTGVEILQDQSQRHAGNFIERHFRGASLGKLSAKHRLQQPHFYDVSDALDVRNTAEQPKLALFVACTQLSAETFAQCIFIEENALCLHTLDKTI